MSLSTAIKVATGLGVSGVTIGGCFLAKSLFFEKTPKNTLANRLSKDEFTPLNTDVSKVEKAGSEWQTIFIKYKEITNTHSNLKIGNITLSDSDNNGEGIIKLKNSCSSLLKTEESSSDFKNNYKLTTKWCVKPISVKDLLEARKITYLDTSSNSANTEEWINVAKRYETDKTASKDTVMSDVNWTTVSSNNYTSNITLIQNACNSRKTKTSYEIDFEKSLSEAQNWCVTNS